MNVHYCADLSANLNRAVASGYFMLVGMKHIRNNLVKGLIATCQKELNTFGHGSYPHAQA